MEFGENLVKTIRFRQEGKDVLSWIENFGLHLFDENCKLNIPFNNGEKNEVLVLRIDKITNTINAYYCFFQTDNRGFTRFCVNKYTEGNDAGGLKRLMDRAKWDDDSTRKYWEEAFCADKIEHVDESTLKRPESKTSPYEEMNMMEYVECIQEEIKKVLTKLSISSNDNISKVLIAEQYAAALPLKYALGRIFPNAKKMVRHFIFKKKIEEKSWQQNAIHFHIPGKLLHSVLNTTPQMTICDVLFLREKGVTFTLPLSKDKNGKYCLSDTSIIDKSELKWSELITEDIEPDYIVGNLAFKRVQLSMLADGFQNVYLICDKDSLVAISSIGQKIDSILQDRNNKEETRQCQNESDEKIVYVIDTNVFLNDPDILIRIPTNCKIGLTAKIIDEIDDNKNKSELKKKAVQAQKNIRQEKQKGNRIIFKEPNLKLLNGLNGAKPDNKILALALTLKKDGYEPIILTSDNGLLLTAALNEIGTLELSEIKNKKNGIERAI